MLSTPRSFYLDEEARKRAAAQLMAQQGVQASSMVQDALMDAEKMAFQKGEADRTQTQREVGNKRNETLDASSLRALDSEIDNREQDNARRAALDAERTRGLRLTDEVKSERAKPPAAPEGPGQWLGGDLNPDLVEPREQTPRPRALAERLRESEEFHDVPTSTVDAEWIRQEREHGARTGDADLDAARAEQARARAARDRRPPVVKPAKPANVKTGRGRSGFIAKRLADYDASIEALTDVQRRASNFDFGPVSTWLNDVGQVTGFDDAAFTRIKADIAGEVQMIMSLLSGAAIPKAEMTRLEAGLPTANMNDTAFREKLASTIDRFTRARKYLAQEGGAAPDDGGGEGEAPPRADGKVKVRRLSDGAEGWKSPDQIDPGVYERI